MWWPKCFHFVSLKITFAIYAPVSVAAAFAAGSCAENALALLAAFTTGSCAENAAGVAIYNSSIFQV